MRKETVKIVEEFNQIKVVKDGYFITKENASKII